MAIDNPPITQIHVEMGAVLDDGVVRWPQLTLARANRGEKSNRKTVSYETRRDLANDLVALAFEIANRVDPEQAPPAPAAPATIELGPVPAFFRPSSAPEPQPAA